MIILSNIAFPSDNFEEYSPRRRNATSSSLSNKNIDKSSRETYAKYSIKWMKRMIRFPNSFLSTFHPFSNNFKEYTPRY